MAEQSREARLSAAFVTLADTLVDGYDMVELLDTLVQECVALVDSDAGGLLIADAGGTLHLIASTSEEAEFVEINQLNAGDGPCVEAFKTGKSLTIADMEAEADRWPRFRKIATEHGFQSMHAIPMRLRGDTIGAMNLYSSTKGRLSESDAAVAQALADVATIGILHDRSLRDATIVADQLQHALHSRIVIEQAKGVIAAQTGADMGTAYSFLRAYARNNHLGLHAVAEDVAARSLKLPVDSPVPEA